MVVEGGEDRYSPTPEKAVCGPVPRGKRGYMKETKKSAKELSRAMLSFFLERVRDAELPSFDKFARSAGLTLSELMELSEAQEFNEAYRECAEIRRDYLIDAALTKRADPSFVKFLLTEEKDSDGTDEELTVTVRVVD